jgi:hypothetical protein
MSASRGRTWLTVALLAGVLACESGTSSPDVPAELVLSAEGVSLTGVEGSQIGSQTVVVSSTAAAGLRWSAVSSVPWLSLTPSSGTTPTPLVVTLSTQGLGAGAHTGTVTVVADGAANSPRAIAVVLTLIAAPRITVSPTTVSLSATTAQSQSAPVSVQITNGGAGALAWTATASAPWVTLSPTSGTAPGALSVGANATGVAAGTHSATVSIAAAGAANSPQSIPVTLTLSSVTHVVAASASPASGGTVSGAGTYTAGASATLVAAPAAGFEFVSWTEGSTQVATTPTYQFTVSANRILVANFRATQLTITTSASPSNGGATSGGGTYAPGASVAVTAVPSSGFAFSGWMEGSATVWGSPTYTFTASASRTLVATFVPASSPSYAITTSSNPSSGGSTSGAGSYVAGASATVSATAASGYAFTNWMEGGSVVSTSAAYTFTANANRALVATFTSTAPGSYTITTSSNPAAAGTTTGAGSYAAGTGVSVTATAAAGYVFANWTEGGSVVSSNANYFFTANANRALVANFTANPSAVTIITTSSPSAGGTTDGGGSYPPGSTVVVRAFANTGYLFRDWTEGGTVLSTDARYEFTATASRNLVATFDPPPTVTVTAPENLDVARPTIAVAARCDDCTRLVVFAVGDTLAGGSTSVNTTISLAAFDGRTVSLAFIGKRGRWDVRVVRTVYVEASPNLEDMGAAGGVVSDYRAGRALYYTQDASGVRVAIRTLASGADEVIPLPPITSAGAMFLTPGGAILAAEPNTLYDWRNGTLRSSGNLNSASSLHVAGSYATFGLGGTPASGATLYRRDLNTGADVTIAGGVGNTRNRVDENGDVAYWTSGDYAVYHFQNGASTRLTNDPATSLWNTYPVTDGINIVYRKHTPCCNNQQYQIILHDRTAETVLSPASSVEPSSDQHYRVRGGWAAFLRPVSDQTRQLWMRSPTGVLQSIGSPASSMSIDALGDNGVVVYGSGERRFLLEPGGAPRDVGASRGEVVFRDGSFYVLLGRRVLKIRR